MLFRSVRRLSLHRAPPRASRVADDRVPSTRAYFGQAVYFMIYSEKKIPSAIERYQREIVRILGVLESVLSARRWLVGDKCSVADLSFVT